MLEDNASRIITHYLENISFSTVELPTMQDKSDWERSSRYSKYMETKSMYVVNDGKTDRYILAPTAEEAAIIMMETVLSSYKDLPVKIAQISVKYRNEMRTKGFLRMAAFSPYHTEHLGRLGRLESFEVDLTKQVKPMVFELLVK